MASNVERKVFSAGECPVCADSGAVLLLRRADSKTIVFFCPLCGVAWKDAPVEQRIDAITSLESVAPNGVVLPTEAEVLGTGIRVTAASSEDWLPLLEDLLSDRPAP